LLKSHWQGDRQHGANKLAVTEEGEGHEMKG
jgi:hypothetical protein